MENNGYNAVSIRKIAKEASVSIGLIYKYFPNGKIDIFKHLSYQNLDENFQFDHEDQIDFEDFPRYMREIVINMLESNKRNIELVKAFAVAALTEDKLLEDIKIIKTEDYLVISKFFNRFKGVDISDKDSFKVLNEWTITIKSILFHSSIFPTIFESDESLVDMLVDISLKIWEYTI